MENHYDTKIKDGRGLVSPGRWRRLTVKRHKGTFRGDESILYCECHGSDDMNTLEKTH